MTLAPKLKERGAKIVRHDIEKGLILVWYGGGYFHVYNEDWTEVGLVTIPNPTRPNYPSFTQVKKEMWKIISAKEGGPELENEVASF